MTNTLIQIFSTPKLYPGEYRNRSHDHPITRLLPILYSMMMNLTRNGMDGRTTRERIMYIDRTQLRLDARGNLSLTMTIWHTLATKRKLKGNKTDFIIIFVN